MRKRDEIFIFAFEEFMGLGRLCKTVSIDWTRCFSASMRLMNITIYYILNQLLWDFASHASQEPLRIDGLRNRKVAGSESGILTPIRANLNFRFLLPFGEGLPGRPMIPLAFVG